jgi:hypothetical protein
MSKDVSVHYYIAIHLGDTVLLCILKRGFEAQN